MSAHKRKHIYPHTSVGQVVERITMTIDGVPIPVIPVYIAAARMGYTESYIRLLCDAGALIAIKVHGRWWVHEAATGLFAPTTGLQPGVTSH